MPIDRNSSDTSTTASQTDTGDGPPMPEMRAGLLDAPQVEQLFSDLTSCTQVLAILEKGGPQDHSQPSRANLAAACDRFLNREVLAVQIRYLYDDAEWIDTLFHTPTGIRAVRCQPCVPRSK